MKQSERYTSNSFINYNYNQQLTTCPEVQTTSKMMATHEDISEEEFKTYITGHFEREESPVKMKEIIEEESDISVPSLSNSTDQISISPSLSVQSQSYTLKQ